MPEVWISCGACFVASALGGALISCMEGGVPLLAGTSSAGSSGGLGGGSTVGGSSRGWTSFDLGVLAEPFPNEEGEEVAQPHPQITPQIRSLPGGRKQRRLLSKLGSPTVEDIYFAHIRAQDLFEVKVEIVRHMAGLDPEGNWLGRGARALDNPRTAMGEPSVERLYTLLEDLTRAGVQSETFSSLQNKVSSKRGEVRDDNRMS
ncbi:hypothetical protein Pyn_01100 [Prunus yedoensis var. nudiflora]|uniref:DUF8018 domain-containing protein n=1 Tax=Prunus yedoensis var. nudiflora TaxID=2094558 RepID=A0A314UND1_PRUYE|nr:hypothetical protein Pyn_01100 [Prunus yedoensis var. nudiflora]